jgi:hypothetical protein
MTINSILILSRMKILFLRDKIELYLILRIIFFRQDHGIEFISDPASGRISLPADF